MKDIKKSTITKKRLGNQHTLVNRISNKSFTIYDAVLNESFKVNFENDNLTSDWSLCIKQLFIAKCGGWNDKTIQSLSGRKGTCARWRDALLRIGVWASLNYPDLPLSAWEESHCRMLIIASLTNKIPWKNEDHRNHKNISSIEIMNRGAIETVFNLLNISRKKHLTGIIVDGLSFSLPKTFLQDTTSAILSDNNINFFEWIEGETWKPISLPVLMALLSDSVATLRSKKTSMLMDYFDYQRSENRVPLRSLIHTNSFSKFCNDKHKNPKYSTAYKGMKELLETHSRKDQPITCFPLNEGEISRHCHSVYDACLVIFLCLTGIRISEITSICADDYDIEVDGTWVFTSDLVKTNFGLSEVRTMSGLVAESAETMNRLSYVEKRNKKDNKKDNKKLAIFSRYFFNNDFFNNLAPRHSQRSITASCLSHRLNNYYASFLLNHPEFSAECISVHPHRFRHSWAEFAIRRFDGNVFEAVRQHFRHSYGSYFTARYTNNKLSDEVKNQIESSYIRELLRKMVEENITAEKDDKFKRDLTGMVVNHVCKAQSANLLDINEVDSFVEDLADEFDSIISHEYGYCLIRTETRKAAKCFDKKTMTPILINGCFELCSGCVNYFSSACSNKENIERIAISHTNMIDNFPIKNINSKALNSSKRVVKRAEIILNNMDIS